MKDAIRTNRAIYDSNESGDKRELAIQCSPHEQASKECELVDKWPTIWSISPVFPYKWKAKFQFHVEAYVEPIVSRWNVPVDSDRSGWEVE